MKVGCHIPSYRMTYFLPAVLKSVSWMDRILVTNSTIGWDDTTPRPDRTAHICRAMNMDNLELMEVSWPDKPEHTQRNIAMSLLSDMDYVFILDSDEILLPGDQRRILEVAAQTPDIEAFGVKTINYFQDLSHVSNYDQGNSPIALVKPSIEFSVTRCVKQLWKDLSGSFSLHHLKFLQPKEDLLWRIKAKHEDQVREFNGFSPCEKNLELESYLNSCGYTNLKSDIQSLEFA